MQPRGMNPTARDGPPSAELLLAEREHHLCSVSSLEVMASPMSQSNDYKPPGAGNYLHARESK